MASNSTDPSATDDDEYQAHDDDEEDDERTIEEEEQFNSDDGENELDDLQADADMPLDQLLKLYSQNGPQRDYSSQNDGEVEDDDDDDDENLNQVVQEKRPHFHHLLQDNRQLLTENGDEDDDDASDSSFEPEIIKVINIGDAYQADVEGQTEYGDREVTVDELLWSPSPSDEIDDAAIDTYLKTIHDEYPSSDDEISLQTLFKCHWNPGQAIVEFRQLPVKKIYAYRDWTSDEIEQLEEGLREFGKNFYKISISKCSNRSVRELVHFYYQWKKSERYQQFMEEQQRLNAITSVTDMIEKFIEEQEQQLYNATGVINPTSSSSSTTTTTTTYCSSELKHPSGNSSISFVTIHQQETLKRSFDQVDHDNEPSTAKKSTLNPTNSSTSTTIV